MTARPFSVPPTWRTRLKARVDELARERQELLRERNSRHLTRAELLARLMFERADELLAKDRERAQTLH
jgi:hypothetical protein